MEDSLLTGLSVAPASSQRQARWLHVRKTGLGGLQGKEGSVEGWFRVGKRNYNREDEEPQSNSLGKCWGRGGEGDSTAREGLGPFDSPLLHPRGACTWNSKAAF